MKQSDISKIAENILSVTKECDINELQTSRERLFLEIAVRLVWQKAPYNATTTRLHRELADELSQETDTLALFPRGLNTALNCNRRLQRFNERFSKTDINDFAILSKMSLSEL